MLKKEQPYSNLNSNRSFKDTQIFRAQRYYLTRKQLSKLTRKVYDKRLEKGESCMQLGSCVPMNKPTLEKINIMFNKSKMGFGYQGIIFNIVEDRSGLPNYFRTEIAFSEVAAIAIVGCKGKEKVKKPFTELTNKLRQETLKEYGEPYLNLLVSFIMYNYKRQLAENPNDSEMIELKFQEECLNAGLMLDKNYSLNYNDILYGRRKVKFIMQPEIEAEYKKRQEKKALENDKVIKDDENSGTTVINLNEEIE